MHLLLLYQIKFLLTHPLWDVTHAQSSDRQPRRISTHTSRVGCDLYGLHGLHSLWRVFLLTHPVWDVTHIREFTTSHFRISTHTSRVGCDQQCLMYA